MSAVFMLCFLNSLKSSTTALVLKNIFYITIGEVLAKTTQAEKADVDLAVKSARKAYETWSKTLPHVRARHLYRYKICQQ